MTAKHTYLGGFVQDLTLGLTAGQPDVRYGGVRAHQSPAGATAPGLLARLLRQPTQTGACRHAMAHAGGAA